MKEIEISTENGSIFGYRAELPEENVSNYLQKHFSSKIVVQIIDWLKGHQIQDIVILLGLSVEEDARGLGVGTFLLGSFLDSAGTTPVLLLCDELQSQQEGFVLSSWYEKHGFCAMPFRNSAGSLMIKR